MRESLEKKKKKTNEKLKVNGHCRQCFTSVLFPIVITYSIWHDIEVLDSKPGEANVALSTPDHNGYVVMAWYG